MFERVLSLARLGGMVWLTPGHSRYRVSLVGEENYLTGWPGNLRDRTIWSHAPSLAATWAAVQRPPGRTRASP